MIYASRDEFQYQKKLPLTYLFKVNFLTFALTTPLSNAIFPTTALMAWYETVYSKTDFTNVSKRQGYDIYVLSKMLIWTKSFEMQIFAIGR